MDETLDLTERRSEGVDRVEAVVLSGEMFEDGKQMPLRIIRTDSRVFLGFGSPTARDSTIPRACSRSCLRSGGPQPRSGSWPWRRWRRWG